MTAGCSYHAAAKADCLYCREAPAREAARIDWLDRCPKCSSGDIRRNVPGRKIWCGQCGAQAQIIDLTISQIRNMRGSIKNAYVVINLPVQ